MRNKERPDPVIPDHEVLRRIGGGAYGEVWLARAVTGALRAVKVVWREDFEDERGFEREFEGILKFEPISRDHPGLVNVLHVGRAPDAASFYYYVMELGDDVRTGREINPIEYEPRTLRTDMQAAGRRPLATELCLDVGMRLAEALGHLHESGLAHRDVKPSNVIFVNGRAKLADIGLVATRGQRTFVGTEGFVPPEGPGSAQADVYSLGKVLYECATGKDRLEFPELPDEIPPQGKERKLWLALNHVVCDVCEPQISRRRIRTAAGMAAALRALQRGKRHRPRSRAAAWATTFFLLLFVFGGAWEWLRRGPLGEWIDPWHEEEVEQPGPPLKAMVRIVSHPEGADVLDGDGRVVGSTPMTVEATVGDHVRYTVKREGFRPVIIDKVVPVSASGEPLVLGDVLQVYAPPEAGQPWTDPLGNRYQPVGENHVASGYVGNAAWKTFEEEEKWRGRKLDFEVSDNGTPMKVVLVDAKASAAYCQWLARVSLRDGYLTEESELWPERDEGFDRPGLPAEARRAGLRPFRPVVGPVAYATLEVTTRPEGAEVYANGVMAGSTYGALLIERLRPGTVDLLAQLGGYREKRVQVKLGKGERRKMELVLEQNQSVVFGAPWQNSLGMRFVPVGKELMVSVWETRVVDYDAFLRENEHPPPPAPDFKQGPDHPVVMVSRDDAEAFSRWLTEKERAQQRIARFDEYRLPTDLEWSRLVGLNDDEAATPAERDARRQHVFPWGLEWPPGEATGMIGNLADQSALRLPGIPPERTIPGYVDGFDTTAPVGAFAANGFGLHDLCGNVHEWVADAYSPRQNLGVLRGAGWNTHQAENLYSGARNTAPPNFHDSYYGFRLVLAKVPPPPEESGGVVDKPGNETPKEKDQGNGGNPN